MGFDDDLMIGICQICWRGGGSVGRCACILMSGKLRFPSVERRMLVMISV